MSLSAATNILTRSQIAVNFLHSQREIKFFSAINTHLVKHSIICTSVHEHDNIITVINYYLSLLLLKYKGLKLQISEEILSLSVDSYPPLISKFSYKGSYSLKLRPPSKLYKYEKRIRGKLIYLTQTKL